MARAEVFEVDLVSSLVEGEIAIVLLTYRGWSGTIGYSVLYIDEHSEFQRAPMVATRKAPLEMKRFKVLMIAFTSFFAGCGYQVRISKEVSIFKEIGVRSPSVPITTAKN